MSSECGCHATVARSGVVRARWVGFGVAVLASALACTSSPPKAAPNSRANPQSSSTTATTAPSTAPSTATTSATTVAVSTEPAAMPPTATQIAAQAARTREINAPSERFVASPPITVADGSGGLLTAVDSIRDPSADGHGGLIFFWHNQTFLGWDTNLETWNHTIRAIDGGIEATYANHAPNDAACCPSLDPVTISYRWTNGQFAQSRPLPAGAVVGIRITNVEPTGDGTSDARSACQQWAFGPGGDQQTRNKTQASAAAQAAIAASRDPRWQSLADAMAEINTLPETDVSTDQQATFENDDATIHSDCAAIGITVP
jgi:LppP/LprE lipoprotein